MTFYIVPKLLICVLKILESCAVNIIVTIKSALAVLVCQKLVWLATGESSLLMTRATSQLVPVWTVMRCPLACQIDLLEFL